MLPHAVVSGMGIITLTKQAQQLHISAASDLSGAGAPARMLWLSRSDLVGAVEAELRDYFVDAYGPTLEQYAVDHIIGGVLLRLQSGIERSA